MLGDKHRLWSDKRLNVALSENGRTYRGENQQKKQLICYRIDGAAITAGARCDFAIFVEVENTVLFIELKGKDISHAADQILATIATFGTTLDGATVHARIVCTRVSHPRIRRASLARLENKIARMSGNVRIASMELQEKL